MPTGCKCHYRAAVNKVAYDVATNKQIITCPTICTTCWSGIRLTFSEVILCSGYNWPILDGDLNKSWDLSYFSSGSDYCTYRKTGLGFDYEMWCRISKSSCDIIIEIRTGLYLAPLYFCMPSGYNWDDGSGNNNLTISNCGNQSPCINEPVALAAAYGGSVLWVRL